ncbi:MAG: ribosome recycling factor [Bacteroidetes bacterium]|nr:ribosome recycling factor [Bacteroidota bacterium]
MEEELEFCLEVTRERMENATRHLEGDLKKIRAGKADPHILDGIFIDYYGARTPLNQVSNIGTPDPRTIAVQPWEKHLIDAIEKAILAANIGLTPMNNGEIIRINIPILTEERRKMLVKQVRQEGENSRITVRNIRRESNDDVKKMKKEGLSEDLAKNGETEIQKITDGFIEKIEKMLEKKEKDIMTI